MTKTAIALGLGLILVSESAAASDEAITRYIDQNYAEYTNDLKIKRFKGPNNSTLYFVSINNDDYCGTGGCKLIVANDVGGKKKQLNVLWDDNVFAYKVLSADQFQLKLHHSYCDNPNPQNLCEFVYTIKNDKLVKSNGTRLDVEKTKTSTTPIPVQFCGVWEEKKKNCKLDRDQSPSRLEISSDELGGNEYSCVPKNITKMTKDVLKGDFDCSVEGEDIIETFHLNLTSDQKLVDRDTGSLYIRCK